ncbi:MAG: c-type cytochrome [Magnetococcales bacterium]|nr:c-type cytochrome [Magnetococcales bacterium]
MKKSLILFPLLLIMVLVSMPVDNVQAGKKDESKWSGKKLYMRKTCMACHGRGGKKAILAYPNLAGQDEKYLANQMKDIASGKRLASNDPTGHPRTEGMKGVMHLVSKDQMKKIAKWLSTESPAPLHKDTKNLDPARVAQGKKIYTKLKCKTCHGVDGKKPLKGKPYVAGQKKQYLVLQMEDMKSGIRKNGQSGTMRAFIKKASSSDIELMAEYLSQVSRAKK